ncbi:MAG: C1 family peptidase [Bacteroidota bacterium]
MRSLLTLLFLSFLCTCVSAQTRPAQSYGAPRSSASALGVSDAQVLDQLMFYIPGVGSPSREDLLRQNIKSYMMPIRQAPDPKLEWAYALAGAVEYYLNLNNNYKDNLSPDYIALNLAAQGQRPTIEDGLRLLIQQGTVSAAIVPYGSPTIPGAVYSVPKHTIANFGYLFRPETRARNRVFEVRKALSRGNPVVIELQTDAAFRSLTSSIYNGGQQPTETHFLTVVGYDGETETFELRGLFGRHWANAGYVRLSYADFGRLARTGYVIIPKV